MSESGTVKYAHRSVLVALVLWVLCGSVPGQGAQERRQDSQTRASLQQKSPPASSELAQEKGGGSWLEVLERIAKIVASIAVTIGIYLAARRLSLFAKQVENAAQGQATDRFIKAIEQLGTEGEVETTVRLGGIYALEKLAQEEPERYHWTVMEVLCTYVRKNAGVSETPEAEATDLSTDERKEQPIEARPRVADDIQAIMTVIGRRKGESAEQQQRIETLEKGKWLNLVRVDLRGADLHKSNLGGAILYRADLRKANLYNADLRKANLCNADLSQASLHGAILAEANLSKTAFRRSKLLGSDFTNANLPPGSDNLKISLGLRDLEPPDFTGADLDSAILAGANLRAARGLGQIQLDAAQGSEYTRVPKDVRPPKWKPEVESAEYQRWLKEQIKR